MHDEATASVTVLLAINEIRTLLFLFSVVVGMTNKLIFEPMFVFIMHGLLSIHTLPSCMCGSALLLSSMLP